MIPTSLYATIGIGLVVTWYIWWITRTEPRWPPR